MIETQYVSAFYNVYNIKPLYNVDNYYKLAEHPPPDVLIPVVSSPELLVLIIVSRGQSGGGGGGGRGRRRLVRTTLATPLLNDFQHSTVSDLSAVGDG